MRPPLTNTLYYFPVPAAEWSFSMFINVDQTAPVSLFTPCDAFAKFVFFFFSFSLPFLLHVIYCLTAFPGTLRQLHISGRIGTSPYTSGVCGELLTHWTYILRSDLLAPASSFTSTQTEEKLKAELKAIWFICISGAAVSCKKKKNPVCCSCVVVMFVLF